MKRTRKIIDEIKGDSYTPPFHTDFILCADIHLMESTPICRLDDFVEQTQWRKLQWLKDLAIKHNCPVLCSGDLFDYWKPSPALLSKTIEHLPPNFWVVYGNHDLPQHNMELKEKSGIYCLEKAGKLKVLQGGHWGQSFEISWQGFVTDTMERKICVAHIMTYQGQEPFPGCTAPKSAKLLRQHPEFDLIVTGDNHKTFVEKHEGRLLVNPGSLFRLTASQLNHKPCVFLYEGKTNSVRPEYYPIESDVISQEHLEVQKERSKRLDAFIESLDGDFEASLTFEDNLEKTRQQSDISDKVMQIIYKSLE